MVLGLAAAVLAGVSSLELRKHGEWLARAEGELRDCQQLVQEIARLRVRPRVASLEVEPSSRIAERVEAALTRSGVRASSLVRVEPLAPVRIGSSSYQLRQTSVSLEDVTLEQVVRFADALSEPDEGLSVPDLVMTAASTPASGGDRWSVQVGLTQMIFSPTIRAPLLDRRE
jgi:hypothetical protein